MPSQSVNWASILGTLAAAFFGAWFAFLLDSRKKRQSEEDAHVKNGNLALYNLHEYWSALKQYHKDVIAPCRDRDDRWLNMPPTTERYQRMPSLLDVDLSYILGTPHTSIYADVYIEEHRFHTARSLIDRRDAMILEKVRPAMTGAGIKEGETVDLGIVESAVGGHVTSMLKIMTEGIIDCVEEDLE